MPSEKQMPPDNRKTIQISPIGYVQNAIDEQAPAHEIRAVESRIVLYDEYVQGLVGLKASKQVLVIFHFDRIDDFALLQHPKGNRNRPKRGVFALCSPRRPNHLGVTVVDLLTIEGNVLVVRGLDALNGTPVIDLKPA